MKIGRKKNVVKIVRIKGKEKEKAKLLEKCELGTQHQLTAAGSNDS